MAYWLELLPVFNKANRFFPVLLLRNSFLLLSEQQATKWKQTGFDIEDLFLPTDVLITRLATREATAPLHLQNQKTELAALYTTMAENAAAIDTTLSAHVEALQKAAIEKIIALEKKMLRAEKRKHAESAYRIQLIRDQLFPGGSLQERIDNMALWYARLGNSWLQTVLDHSSAITNGFTVITLRNS